MTGFTELELARIAVQRLDELARNLQAITVPMQPPERRTTLFEIGRHHLEALRRVIGNLDQYAIRDELRRRPIVWRIAPAGDGLPAAIYADRPGLGSVSLAINPETLQRHGWHYLADLAQQMTEALS